MEVGSNTNRNAFIFTWKIENFDYYYEKMYSPVFFVHSIDSEFSLELSCSHQKSDQSFISCYLKLARALNWESSFIKLDCEFAFLTLGGSTLISKMKVEKKFKEGKRRGFRDLVPLHDVIRNLRNAFLPQGTLTLQCTIWKSHGEMSEAAVCFARTRLGIEQSSFVWPIEEFSAFMDEATIPHSVRKASKEDPLISMNFQLATTSLEGKEFESEGKEFELELTPEDALQICSDMNRKDTDGEAGFYDFKLSFLNASGYEKFYQEKKRLLSREIHKLQVFITEDLLKKENGYLVDDALSLKCQFTFYQGIISEGIEKTLFGSAAKSYLLNSRPIVLHHNSTSACISSLKDIHKFLYDTKTFCDVKLIAKTYSFFAHKCILSAKSRVFQSMFDAEMKGDVVEILDVSVDVLLKMIHYIYTDTVDYGQLESIYGLFEAAKKYKIASLQKKCCLILSENLSKYNACEMLCFADKHMEKKLKVAVQNFILEQKEDVIGSTAWKILQNKDPVLAEEIHLLM